MRRFITTREAMAWAFAGLCVLALIAAILVSLATQASTTDQIQRERARNISESCLAQNRRHDNTIHQLDALIAKVPKDRQARAKASRDGTVLLIDALAPKRDCAAVVRTQVRAGL